MTRTTKKSSGAEAGNIAVCCLRRRSCVLALAVTQGPSGLDWEEERHQRGGNKVRVTLHAIARHGAGPFKDGAVQAFADIGERARRR